MAQRIEVPGHGIVEFPDGMSEAQIVQAIKANEPKQKSIGDQVKQGLGNLVAGAVRGAGSIGATLLYPIDKYGDYQDEKDGVSTLTLSSLVTGQNKPRLTRNEQRRADMDAGLAAMGAEPDSLLYKGGKLGGEIAGTAGAGSALAAGARAAPFLATKAPALINALETSGMSAGGLTGARGLAVRAAGGAAAGGVSAGMIDPEQAAGGAVIGGALPPALMVAGKVGSAIGSGVRTATKNALGLSTGVGAEPISQAFKAGKTGNQAFLDNIRGDVPLTDVLDQAKAGLQAMNAAKTAEYRSGMIPIQGDKSVLSLAGIDKALQDAASVGSFKGQVKNEAAGSAVQKMRDAVDQWKQLDPAEFHTPEGLDALKQKLVGILEAIPFEQKTARLAAGKVYNATKAEIEKQAPTYSKVMKDYTAASEQIHEVERALSLNNKASQDTAMRKLQSLMRNNVQTNYGNRLTLANTLEDQGGVELMPALAGQALNSWTPRSLSGQLGSGAAVAGAFANPLALGLLPMQSPRLVGSLAYGAGRLSGAAQSGAARFANNALSQARLSALANDPSALAQFGYRSVPALVADR